MGLKIAVTSILQNPLQSLIDKPKNPLLDISTFNDLYIFEPRNQSGVDIVIPDTVGSAVTLSQTTPANRPTPTGQYLTIGNDNNDSRGVITSQSITFRELFVVCQYSLSTFDNFATIISGTGSLGAKRIMGSDGTNDLVTSSSINDSGLVRINNAAETATDIIPFDLSVLHSCTDFTTPLDISDTVTIGYNSDNASRAWQGLLGVMIFSRIALDNTQRQEIVDAMRDYHNI